MLRSEFEQRVNYKVTEEEFKSINEMYMDTDFDKDDFCLLYNASQFITKKVADVARERKNDYLVAVTMRDKYAREIKSAMFYPDASCVLLVIGNYKKAPYTYKFQEIRDRKVARVKKMPLAKFKYLLDLFGGTPYITFKK